MSKMAAVDTAVRLQMASDGKDVPYASKMNVGTGYPTSQEVEKFLLGVGIRLKLDTPSLVFDWSSMDASKAMDQTRQYLQSLIEERTKNPIEQQAKSAESK
jgi:hypothetical protein